MSALKILHLHSSFDPGGKELRSVELINAFGAGLHHTIVSAVPEAMGAASRLLPAIPVDLAPDFPALQGRPLPRRLMEIARALSSFDLVLTYNFGAMDAVLAHTIFGDMLRLPPLVHHEDGFNQDEVEKRKGRRNWFRRIALGRAQALVVPSQQLEAIAITEWHQPRARVQRVANGIDTAAYARKPRPDALPRIIKRPGEKWLGTLAGLRAVKDLPRLVRAFCALPDDWQLVILGEGPEREAIRAAAMEAGVGHRLHLPGHVPEPAKVVGLFDLFALSSQSEQFPISLVEAMAAGLAVASMDVGDVKAMVAVENQPFIVADEAALAQALVTLAQDQALRERIGAANRARARVEYDKVTMVAAYADIYGAALGKTAFP
ncbi:MAG: glycosyltransferase family 4 protein [Sphingomonadales bacterium]|nr:glycosyltransferase family 4 protein [Sphingomonadales bacterium]MDE2169214.1 glycosyltransferase family 4 protein [Sphingomonadales bacterium]